MIHEPAKNGSCLFDLHLLLQVCDHSAVRDHLLEINYSDDSYETIIHLFATFLQGYIR